MADAYSGSVDPTEAAGTFEGDGTETTMVGSSATALSTFDDDAGEKRPKKSETTTNQTRAQARANAHHIQKFVNQQVFGEATLDDLDDDPDLEEHKSQCCGLLHPRTKASIAYDLMQMSLLWYIVGTVPWRIAFNIRPSFDESAASFVVDILVDLAIVFDIGLNFRRYYFDDRSHKLITEPAAIRTTYLKSWFLIDFISVIPFDRIVELMHSGNSEQMRSTKMVRLARLARFARLARLTKLASLRRFTKMVNESLRSIGVSKPGMEFVGRIMFLAGVILFVTHVVACLWINSGRTYTERCALLGQEGHASTDEDWDNCLRTPGDSGWIAGAGVPNWYTNEYWGGAVAVAHDDGDGILNATEFEIWDGAENRWTVYLDACYWVLVTMSTVGYGDITPKSSVERVYSCGVIILGAFLWAYIIGSFSATLNSMDRDKARYDEQMRSIKAMMKFHDVPPPLVERIDSFFEYKFESKTLFDDANIYEVLPARLRADLILHRFKDIINMIPFFRGCREDAVIEIVSRMKSFSVLPGDYLFHKGDPYVELIVLTKGRMAVVTEGGSDDVMAAEYFPGAFFGENEFLGFARERHESIRARTFAEVSTLHPEDMEPILKIHIKLRRRLERYAKLKIEMEKGLADSLDKKYGAVDTDTLMKLKEDIESAWENESKELRDAFDKVDLDASGYIDRWEIGELAKEMGRPMKEWELDEAMHAMDADGSGQVDYDEFAHWWDQNDARLAFSGRDPAESHNRTMKTMQESLLDLQHKLAEQVKSVEQGLETHIENMSADFVWLREKLK